MHHNKKSPSSQFSGGRVFPLIAAGILLLAFGLRAWDLGEASLWVDEAWSAKWAAADFSDMLRNTVLRRAAIELPLYISTLQLFPTDNEFSIRFPSVIASLIGIAAFILLLRRICQNESMALWGGIVLATNPLHIWLARTARPYAYFLTAVVFVTFFFLMLLKGRRSKAIWSGLIISSMLAYLTHYFALFLPVVQYLLFGIYLKRFRSLLRPWLLTQAIAGLGLLTIWIVQLLLNNLIPAGIGWIPEPNLSDILLSVRNMMTGYTGTVDWFLLVGLICSGVGFAAGLVRSFLLREPIVVFWLLLTTIPLGAIFIVSKLLHPLYVDRYLSETQVGATTLMLLGWWWMPWRRSKHALAFIAVLSGLLVVWQSFSTGDYVREDWRASTAYIADRIQPGDQIVLDAAFNEIAFLHYFEPADHFPRAIVHEAGAEIEPGILRIWAVYRNPIEDVHRQGVMPDFDPFDPTLSPMGQWLASQRDRVLQRANFNGITVLLMSVQ